MQTINNETLLAEHNPGSLVRDLLHAMGQPLTALQMCVLLRDHGWPTGASDNDLLTDMADQVTSLTRLFASLRNLIEHGSLPVAVTAFDLRHSVHHRLARWHKEATVRKITLVVRGLTFPDYQPIKVWNGGPLQVCLQDVFEAALLSCPTHGQVAVELLSGMDSNGLLLRVRGGDLLPESSFSARYGLPVARALLNSAAQQCTYTTRPFEVTLKLLSPEPTDVEDAVPQPRAEHGTLRNASR